MKNSYVLGSSREILLARTVSIFVKIALVLFAITISVSIVLLVFKQFYLTIGERTALLTFSLVPFIVAAYTFFIYENLVPGKRFNKITFFKIVLFLLYLLGPPVFVAFRYNNILSNFLAVYALLGTFIGIASPFLKIKPFQNLYITQLVLEVVFYTWSAKFLPLNVKYFEIQSIRESRKFLYYGKAGIDVFQKFFLDVAKESEVICEKLISNNFSTENEINVLDVGGHNGQFTASLLGGIGAKVKKLYNVDPIQHEKYEDNLSLIASEITRIPKRIEEFDLEEDVEFNLIIASHSLYASVDLNNCDQLNLINRLIKLLDTKGLLIVTLGSNHSPAYEFKKDVLKLLIDEIEEEDENVKDFDAESLRNTLDLSSDIYYTTLKIDNYFNVTNILSDKEEFKLWLSYFTRTELIDNHYLIQRIKNSLLFYSILPTHLPNCVSQREVDRYVTDKLLLHKTMALIISKEKKSIN